MLGDRVSGMLDRVKRASAVIVTSYKLPVPGRVGQVSLTLGRKAPSFLRILRTLITSVRVRGIALTRRVGSFGPRLGRMLRGGFASGSCMSRRRFGGLARRTGTIVHSKRTAPCTGVVLRSKIVF